MLRSRRAGPGNLGLVHAAIALACLAYLVDLVLAAGALYR